MPLTEAAVRDALQAELGGSTPDEDVVGYAASCLADADLDWGDAAGGCEGAFDAVGAVLLESCGDEEKVVRALLARLASRLQVGASAPAPAAPAVATRRATPFVMGGLTEAEAGTALGKVAKGVIVACTDGREMDEGKATKRRTREEAKAKEAYERHLSELAASAAGGAPARTVAAPRSPARRQGVRDAQPGRRRVEGRGVREPGGDKRRRAAD